MVHRDLKPANILIKNGVYKIADFGFAKVNDDEGMYFSILGSPLFMAPEVRDGAYTDKCDLYSLGKILYLMLTGSYAPYKLENRTEVVPLSYGWDAALNISDSMKNLVDSLSQPKPGLRMDWIDFFAHPLVKQTEVPKVDKKTEPLGEKGTLEMEFLQHEKT